jgi:hypothetical protein
MELITRWSKNSNRCEGEIDNKFFDFSIDKHEKVPQTVEEIISASIAGKLEMFGIIDHNSEIDTELLTMVIKYGGVYENRKSEISVILNNECFSIGYRMKALTFYNSSGKGCYPWERISYAEAIGMMAGISNQNRNSTQSGRGMVGANSDYDQSRREKNHGSFEKIIELFNLCKRKDEFGYVRKNGEVFEIHEKISNTKIYASENFCVFEKAGSVESVAIKDSNVRFEKPAGVFKNKLSFLSGDEILIIGEGKAEYRILEYGRFPEKPEPALSERETEMELLKLCQELEKTNIIKNIEKVKEIIAGKETEVSPEEKKFNELSLKIAEINL